MIAEPFTVILSRSILLVSAANAKEPNAKEPNAKTKIADNVNAEIVRIGWILPVILLFEKNILVRQAVFYGYIK